MDEFEQRILHAGTDGRALEALLRDYLPFIKSEVAKVNVRALEYDDKMSLGMLVFVGCVRQYDVQRGALLPYVSVCIRNRLIDEARKLGKVHTVSLSTDEEEKIGAGLDEKVSLAEYDTERERRDLQEEIAAFSSALAPHGFSYGELPRICPKQKRSRALCAALARRVLGDGEMLAAFQQHGRLLQKRMAREAGISEKTVEKYRRYIVALLVILLGDYPGIGAYVPGYGRETE